jgi:ribosome-associated protein
VGSALADPEVNPGERDASSRRLHDRPGRLLRAKRRSEGGPLKLATQAAAPFLTLSSLERACLSARVATENKARDVVVLDMRKVTPLYDFFVLASGTSRRQIHTISEEIDATLHEHGDRRLSIEGYEASKWVVQDYGDVVVHVFDPDTRQYYSLEDLWADAPRVDWERYAP